MTKPYRIQHDATGGGPDAGTGFRLVLLDEQPATRARLTAAEVLDLFRPGTPSPVESRPFIRRRRSAQAAISPLGD
ncbi:MAG TPA: hypothetical protein VF160_17365 [Candidatus Dormibacteraeota bacterium]